MPNYSANNYETSEDSVVVVLASIETKLETLDSTNNPLYLIKIKPLSNGKFIGVLVYD